MKEPANPSAPAGAPANNGLIHVRTGMSVPDAFAHLESVVNTSGLRVFARIDFSGDAEAVGLKMRESKMLIFGSPKAGTPVMVAAATAAMDLPLKVLVWRDAEGGTWLTYNDPEYIRARHHVPADLIRNISGVAMIVNQTVQREAAA